MAASTSSQRFRAWLGSPVTSARIAAGALLAMSALTLTNPGVALTGTGMAVAGVGSVVQAVAMFWRRSAAAAVLAVATAVLVVTVVATGDPVAAELGVAFAVYAVAVSRRAAVTWACWAGVMGVAAVAYSTSLDATSGGPLPSSMLGFAVVTLGALALGVSVRARRQRVVQLEERARQLALERDQREQLAAAAERTRIAREMHDVVAHSLSVMVALAHGASAALESQPERARDALAELSRTGREALTDARRIVGLLRDDAAGSDLDPAGGSLAELVGTYRSTGLPVVLVERGSPLPEDPALRHAVYRVVQECLTNVLRHAPESPSVRVLVDRVPDRVTVEVSNACPPAARLADDPGYGLAGIRERAAVHRGTVVSGATAEGWRVATTLRYPGGGR